MASRQWTEQDLFKMVTNPVYVGLGPFPRMIEDDVFIGVIKNVIKEKGLRLTLETLRGQLQITMNREVRCISDSAWIDQSVTAIKQQGPTIFFRDLLGKLREKLG